MAPQGKADGLFTVEKNRFACWEVHTRCWEVPPPQHLRRWHQCMQSVLIQATIPHTFSTLPSGHMETWIVSWMGTFDSDKNQTEQRAWEMFEKVLGWRCRGPLFCNLEEVTSPAWLSVSSSPNKKSDHVSSEFAKIVWDYYGHIYTRMSKLYSCLTYNHQSKLTTAIRTVWNKFRLTGKVPEQGESLSGSHSLSAGVDIFCNYHYFTKTRTSHWYLAINISAAPVRILAANPEGSLLPQSLTESTDQTSLLGSTPWGSRVSLRLSWVRRFSRKSLNLILLFTPRWRLNILRKTIARSVWCLISQGRDLTCSRHTHRRSC